MSTAHIGLVGSVSSPDAIARPGRDERSLRVLVLIPVICLLNLIDLFFTQLAFNTYDFNELNPLALHLGATGRVMLKLFMLISFAVLFFVFRRRRSVELGCYILLTIYGALAIVWLTKFNFLLTPYFISHIFTGL